MSEEYTREEMDEAAKLKAAYVSELQYARAAAVTRTRLVPSRTGQAILDAMDRLLDKSPSLRVMQLLLNALPAQGDHYYTSDVEVLDALLRYEQIISKEQ